MDCDVNTTVKNYHWWRPGDRGLVEDVGQRNAGAGIAAEVARVLVVFTTF